MSAVNSLSTYEYIREVLATNTSWLIGSRTEVSGVPRCVRVNAWIVLKVAVASTAFLIHVREVTSEKGLSRSFSRIFRVLPLNYCKDDSIYFSRPFKFISNTPHDEFDIQRSVHPDIFL